MKVKVKLIFSVMLLVIIHTHPSYSQSENESTQQFKGLPIDKQIAHYLDLSEKAKDSLSLASKYGLQALELALKSGNVSLQALCKKQLALINLEHDLYDEALLLALDALRLYEVLGDTAAVVEIKGHIGWLYFDAEQPDKALQFHKEVVAVYKQKRDHDNLAWSLNALGLSYYKKKDYEQAFNYFKQSLQIGRALNSSIRVSSSLNNMGMTLTALKRYEEAIQVLDSAATLNKQSSDLLKQAESLNQLGNAYTYLGKLNEAKQCLEDARKFIAQSASNIRKEKLLDNYEYSVNLFTKQRDHKEALHFMQLYIALKEDILSIEKQNNLGAAQFVYETKLKEQEIELLEAENKLKVFQRDALAAAFLLIGIIGAILYHKRITSQQKEIQIREARQALTQNELEKASLEKSALEKEFLLAETQSKLALAELEKSKIEREALQSKLDFKNAEFTKAAIHLSQRNELVRTFLDELKGINHQVPTELSVKLNKIINHFTLVQGINSDAETFHMNMEVEYKEFLFRLTSRFPDLTENEKRLCSQIRLNLSIKDIASINNISVKSVEMARYRLRKKIGLDHEEGLANFLHNL